MVNKKKVNGNGNINIKKETINFEKKIMTIIENGQEKNIPLNNKQIAQALYGSKLQIRGKNKKQKDLLVSIGTKEITIAVGPSGTGKSFCSIAKALELLAHSENNYQKIFIVTPNVELPGSEMGWLPGDVAAKLSGFLFSTYYLLDKIIGKKNREKLVEMKIVDTMPITYMRGVNFDSCIVLAEEVQNLSILQFKTLITRIGYGCKYIVSGDLEQVDIKDNINGLEDALNKFKDMEEIGIIKFDKDDSVRNPIISKLLSKY